MHINSEAWSDLFDEIIVVSLAKSVDRRRYIDSHLPTVGIHRFNYFGAVDASTAEVKRSFSSGLVATFPPCFRCAGTDCGNADCNNFLSEAQVATVLTYRKLWSHIATGRSERVLVLEDDVKIMPHSANVLRELKRHIDGGSINFSGSNNCLLRLGWAECSDHEKEGFHVTTAMRMSNPAHGITRSFARCLPHRLDVKITHTADILLHKVAPLDGEAHTVFPPIASELSWSTGKLPSLIHPKPEHSHYLQSIGDNFGASKNDELIKSHVKKKTFRPLLLVGHPRCGTGFAANLCKQFGLDIGHEKLGQDGISSWMFAVESAENPYAGDDIAADRRRFGWRHLIVPVRAPKTAIPSIIRDSIYAPPSYEFRRDQIKRALGIDLDSFQNPLERAIWSLCSWMRIILKMNPDLVFRIESDHAMLKNFLRTNGYLRLRYRWRRPKLDPINQDKPYQGIRRPKPTEAELAWLAVDDKTKRELNWYCTTLGYESPV